METMMARIPETEIERLKAEVSLARLAESRGVKLAGHGDNLLGLCPFHDDKSPSLVISPAKNVWHCLGACQAGGSVIDWVMRAERVSFRLAVEMLRKDAPSLVAARPKTFAQPKIEELAEPDEPDAVVLRRVVLEDYPNNLKQSPEPQAYLEKRGLANGELVEHFKLGYANRTLGYRIPSSHVKEGATVRAQLQRIGLYRTSGHEHFTGSLTIPVLGEDGEVLEVYGRRLNDHLRKGTPLHLYLPARPDGRRGVFNLAAFSASKDLVLCEALIDALTFWAAGHRNVTSAYGVEGFTKEMRDALIEHETKRVLIAYDADAAGDRAAEKLAPELATLGLEVFRVRFPRGMDANAYALKVQPAAKAFEAAISGAQRLAGTKPVTVVEVLDTSVVDAPEAPAANDVPRSDEAPCHEATPAEATVVELSKIDAGAPADDEATASGSERKRARFRGAEVDRLQRMLSLVRLVEAAGVKLQPRGLDGDRVGLCPFHADTKPTLVISSTRNVWRCEGPCQIEGGVFEWMRRIERVAVALPVEPGESPSLAAQTGTDAEVTAHAKPEAAASTKGDVATPEEVRPAPEPAPGLAESPRADADGGLDAAEVNADEVRIRLGDRRWRVRGLSKNTSYDALRVNLLVSAGGAFYVDTLELYSARHRAVFLKDAARELKVDERILKGDIAKIILRLEDLVSKRIEQALAPAAKPEMSAEERAAALELLKDPRLLERILEDFEGAGVVGEETNKLVGYLAAVSRKLDAPLAVVIQSSSAAGKSSLMDAVLRFMPEEERVQYSAMTGQSLFYMGETDLAHKILAIAEEQGAQSASYALKLLQSEGELTIASTGKDPESGKLVTHNYCVKGPVMIFMTTTAIEVDEELLNRCIVLTVDEGAAQTGAIHARQREAQTLEGLLKKQTREARIRLHQNAQRLLEPLAVVNPLAKKLRFSTAATRARRDHMKYLNLIQTVALLHQHQREVKEVQHLGRRVRYIEVIEADVAVADRLAKEVLGGGHDELPPQTLRLLEALRRMVDDEAKKQGVEKSLVRFTRRDVREATRWSDSALKKHLGRLEDLEYLLVHAGGARRRMSYELAARTYDSELVTPPGDWSPSGHPLVTGGGGPGNSSNIQTNLDLVTPPQKTLPAAVASTGARVGIASYTNGAAQTAAVAARPVPAEKGPN